MTTQYAVTQLRNELSRLPADRDNDHLVKLLVQLGSEQHFEALPILDAVSRHYPSETVRAAAAQAAAAYTSSLQCLWDCTVVDQISTPEQRAQRLARLPELELAPLEFIQTVFNEMKGEPIQASNDPRLPVLRSLLADCTTRLSSAINFSICQSYKA